MAEQIADAGDPPPPAAVGAELGAPSAGRPAADQRPRPEGPAAQRGDREAQQRFLSRHFELDAVGADRRTRSRRPRSSPLAPIDMAVPDRVRVLVPVPQAVYEAACCTRSDRSEFQATLDRFLLRAPARSVFGSSACQVFELVRRGPPARAGGAAERMRRRSKPRASPRGAAAGRRRPSRAAGGGPASALFDSATSLISVSAGQNLVCVGLSRS